MDINAIFIRDLKLSCLIGVYPHERLATQILVVQVKLMLSNIPARQSDQLEDTIDYEKLEAHLVRTAQQSSFLLIEKLAQVLLDQCLAFDPRIQGVELELEKPGCLKHARSAGVMIHSRPHS